ncbi:uncharacterized protein LOC122520387 [Polistes fuscatus]|uniref:uncharacterized protein LOC122520387 n=1 Tax=Polistes fuscatus TaxID=30207 RepID=UPI001CA86D94|nr:uncharacterized protein LOC122520387 [Polistes fuscatus]
MATQKSTRFLKAQITKAYTKSLAAADITTYSLKHFKEELESDFRLLKEQYCNFEGSTTQLEQADKEFSEYEDRYLQARDNFLSVIDTRLNRTPNETLEDRPMNDFFERQSQWLEQVNNQSQTKKLNHLMSLVEGEPASLIQHYDFTNENYKSAWETLMHRYDKPFTVTRSLISSLVDLNCSDKNNSTFENWAIPYERAAAMELLADSQESRAGEARKQIKSMTSTFGTCFVCGQYHKIFKCEKFVTMPVADRIKLTKNKNRCLNCFGLGHMAKRCTSRGVCIRCSLRHHTLLHEESGQVLRPKSNDSTVSVKNSPDDQESSPGLVKMHFNGSPVSTRDLLPTAVVQVNVPGVGGLHCRVLLDSGSQACFISEDCLRRLNLKREKSRVPVQVMSRSSPLYSHGIASVVLSSCYDSDVRIPATMKGKYYHKIDKLWVQETSFGYIVAGGNQSIDSSLVHLNCSVVGQESNELNGLIERFWKMEEPPSESVSSPNDLRCEEVFLRSVNRLPEGRYSVDLPLRDSSFKLGESYHFALRRFRGLERNFKKNPLLKLKYFEIVDFFKRSGFMERMSDNYQSINVSERFYLPHYGVCREANDLSKLRIVFDASMKSDNGLSLNDTLLTGPNLQREIFEILLEFRSRKYVFTADICKMYRQIFINEPFRNYQRFLWRESPEDSIQEWRLMTVTDGETCSPFLALRTLQQLADDERERFPIGAEIISQRYMDDFFVGDDDLPQLLRKQKELIDILSTAGMILGKWASNNEAIFKNISDYSSNEDLWRCLIGQWDSSRIFDPLGLLSPITLNLKVLFQETWIMKLGWDDPLPDPVIRKCCEIFNDIGLLRSLRIERYVGFGNELELHGFCDASNKAYAAVVYCRGKTARGTYMVRLLCSKTRLAPIKTITMPRLELCGAHLLAKLLREIVKVYQGFLPRVFCWSDSRIVLSWLRSHPSRWKTFVSNRCSNIHEILPQASWRYVRSLENPADIATRGATISGVVDSKFWWLGPRWLYQNKDFPLDLSASDTKEEIKRVVVGYLASKEEFWSEFVNRFSDLQRLRYAFCYVTRFLNNARYPDSRIDGSLTVPEVGSAFLLLIRRLQIERFQEEIHCLQTNKSIKKSSKIVRCCPFLDSDGILRISGRLLNAKVGHSLKNPIVLERDHFSRLLVNYVHLKYYHSGLRLTLTLIRQNFWIPGVRLCVKSVISKCIECRKRVGKTYSPEMGHIPSYKFEMTKPFGHSGIDFAGPFKLRPYRGRELTSESLIMALKRFVSRRGACTKLYSDNGRNFRGCARILKETKEHFCGLSISEDVRNFLLGNLMEWSFIPAYSPHLGGIWESSVKSVKRHLFHLMKNHPLTYEEFNTVIIEIKAILNSRPLGEVSDSIEDYD